MKLSNKVKFAVLAFLFVWGIYSMRLGSKWVKFDVMFLWLWSLLNLDPNVLPIAHMIFVYGRVAVTIALCFLWADDFEKEMKARRR